MTLRHITAAALASLALASPGLFSSAHAGVVIKTYTHGVDEQHHPVYQFDTSPFGFTADSVPGAGTVSIARAIDRERSFLPTGPQGQPELRDVTEDSGVRISTTAGQTLQASASLGGLSLPGLGAAVARAQSSLFENHASAATAHQLLFWNSEPVDTGGSVRPPGTLYLEHHRTAKAESGWFDTWTADGSASVDMTVRLDGRLASDPFCGGQTNCFVNLPSGTDAVRSDKPYLRLEALFIVYDLDQLAYCPDELLDDCGYSDVGHPLPMSILTARFQGDDDLPIDLDHQASLSFQAIAGHRYLAMSVISVEAQDGGVIDFFNTLRLTDVNVAPGVLRSAATGGDLAAHFARDPGVLPAPATLWLLLLAGGVAAGARRRRVH